MGTTNRKLPRLRHAERPRPDEIVRKRGGADLQNGWYGRHGTLYLTDERIVFVPTVIDTALGAKRRELRLDDVVEVERYPSHPEGMIPGGKRPRVIIHTADCGYELMVGDIDAWIDAIEIVYAHRVREGISSHVPTVVREGSTTAALRDL
jgi:hypothetical protein